jgi:hypothetical protein
MAPDIADQFVIATSSHAPLAMAVRGEIVRRD